VALYIIFELQIYTLSINPTPLSGILTGFNLHYEIIMIVTHPSTTFKEKYSIIKKIREFGALSAAIAL
jgi:hypothetical protein